MESKWLLDCLRFGLSAYGTRMIAESSVFPGTYWMQSPPGVPEVGRWAEPPADTPTYGGFVEVIPRPPGYFPYGLAVVPDN